MKPAKHGDKTMINPTQFLQAAIDHAKIREAEICARDGARIFSGHAAGWAETPIGKISVSFVAAAGRTTFRPEHLRQTWNLNGKRIARDKLIVALREADDILVSRE